MPIKDLTFNQLQHLQLSPVLKGLLVCLRFGFYKKILILANKPFYDFGEEDQKEENMPFASLQKVLELVDPKCAFNVEIKYPQQKIVSIFYNLLDIKIYLIASIVYLNSVVNGNLKRRLI